MTNFRPLPCCCLEVTFLRKPDGAAAEIPPMITSPASTRISSGVNDENVKVAPSADTEVRYCVVASLSTLAVSAKIVGKDEAPLLITGR